MAKIFDAMKQKKSIYLIHHHNQSYHIVPLRLYISSQNGRCHLLAYSYRYKQIKTFRIDHIKISSLVKIVIVLMTIAQD